MKKCKVLHIIGVMTICTMLCGCGTAHQAAQSDEMVEEVTSQNNQDAAVSPETEDKETEEAPSEFVYQELLDGIYDNEYAEVVEMTENEFWELDDELYNRVLEFELTPFSTYTCFGDK